MKKIWVTFSFYTNSIKQQAKSHFFFFLIKTLGIYLNSGKYLSTGEESSNLTKLVTFSLSFSLTKEIKLESTGKYWGIRSL